jgi:hypothetical protein
MNYTASNDFEHCMMMAADLRSEDKNSRAAVLLEMAAEAVRRSQKRVWLLTRQRPVNRPVRQPRCGPKRKVGRHVG